jgi:alpha-beta hydrolase superfamily lysophospholipase
MLPDFSSLCQEPRAGLRYALTSGSELPGSKWEQRSVKQRDGNLAGARNYNIYFQYWEPDESARAVILVVHGAGEHSGRYARFAEYFTARGYSVAALDHPNHGRSDGTYGHVERFDDFLQTLRLFHRQLSADFAGLPVFLLGHSMGGLISSLYLLEHQAEFVGCVLSGPAIKTDIEPPWIQLQLIRLFSAVLPRLGVLQLDANGVSRDPAEVDKYVNDPLVNHSKMTARKVAELFRGMHRIEAEAGRITLPLLILHGGEDPMTAPAGSTFLHDNVGSLDKTLKIYPGLYHEIFNEPEREAIFGEVLAWCDQHLEQSA